MANRKEKAQCVNATEWPLMKNHSTPEHSKLSVNNYNGIKPKLEPTDFERFWEV